MNKKLEEKRNKERLARIVKLPENKKCFDCAGRGRTAYVVMPLWTFVCTGCSGVHREFSHRVLSITLHSFTKEQIDQLEAGGNKAAQARWLATWDSRDFPMPVRAPPPALSLCRAVMPMPSSGAALTAQLRLLVRVGRRTDGEDPGVHEPQVRRKALGITGRCCCRRRRRWQPWRRRVPSAGWP